MVALVESYLYLGDYDKARQCLLADWDLMSRSFILRWQTVLTVAIFLRGRVALACWLENRRDATLRAEVKYYAKRLKKVRPAWGQPMSLVLQAGVAAGDDRNIEAVRLLEDAGAKFDEAFIHGFASAALQLAGLLSGDERGIALKTSASEFWQSQEVVNPSALLRMYLPGRWVVEDRPRTI